MQEQAESFHGAPRERAEQAIEAEQRDTRGRYLWFLLLLPCYAAYLLPGIFARQTPTVAGIPFFYWWQFCWIFVTAITTAIVYRLVISRHRKTDD